MTGIRFKPPPVDFSPEADWLLARAFGPAAAPVTTSSLDPRRVLDIGERLSLLSRIRSRHREADLRREIGQKNMEALGRGFYSNAATVMRHEVALRDIAEVSSHVGFSIILLKGMALHFLGKLAVGSRRCADIDILVPVGECQPLYEALQRVGFSPSGIAAPEHHLSVLSHPLGSALEIHHVMDGVRMGEDGYATADACLRDRLVVGLPGFPDACYLPSESLLLAQLLVHGLGHHGKAPDSYPPFQLVADLQDLGLAAEDAGEVRSQIEDWIGEDVSSFEIQAVLDLTRRLSRGESGSEIAAEVSDVATLLRHFVAGVLDKTYLESLKLSRRLDARSGRGRVESISRTAWGAVWLTDLQIETLYGKPKSPAGYLGYRLWRPLDLMIRLVRYSGSWLISRFRGRQGDA